MFDGFPMKTSDYVVHSVISVFLIVGVYQFYFWCQRRRWQPVRSLKLPVDDWIPYCPHWVWVYSFLYYPIIVYVNAVVKSPRHFLYVIISYVILLVMQMAFFLVFPVETPKEWRDQNQGRNASERFLLFIYRFDARSNAFPSMHTSVAMLTAMHLFPQLGPWAFLFPVLISISCLFTKAHFLVDLPPGAALGWFAYYLFTLTYP